MITFHKVDANHFLNLSPSDRYDFNYICEPDPVSHMATDHSKLKAWQSKYDPAWHTPKLAPASNLPTLDSLPAGLWVALRKDGPKPEGYVGIEETIMPWIREHGLKLRSRFTANTGTDASNPIRAEVFLFKKSKDAMLFKLAWG